MPTRFKDWYAAHEDDPSEWYIGFRAGWVYIGQPKDCKEVLLKAVQDAYRNDITHHQDVINELRLVEHYTENVLTSLNKVSDQIKNDAFLDKDKMLKTLKDLLASQANIRRYLIRIKGEIKEPTPPKDLDDIEVKEKYISVLGQKCLTLKGPVPGVAWDKVEYIKWLRRELNKYERGTGKEGG